jgi:hypothetical protein
MPQLVILTGPIAIGKNTAADKLGERLIGRRRIVVVADVDDVAGMVATPGAAKAEFWFAAHEAHGALVGQDPADQIRGGGSGTDEVRLAVRFRRARLSQSRNSMLSAARSLAWFGSL